MPLVRPHLFIAGLLCALASTPAAAQVISSNTTWSGTVNLDRDVIVNSGVTLTVSAGTTINITTTDAANIGSVAGKVEIIVQGTMNVNGTSGSPVLFTSAGASAGSWSGVRVDATGSLTLTSATIEEATSAIDSNGAATVTGSTLRTNTYGFRSSAGTNSVAGTLLSSNSYGAYGVAGSLNLDHVTAVSNSYGVYSSGTSGAVTVTNSALTGNTYGLYRSNTILISNSNDLVWGNSSADYSSTSAGTGNITANPLYVGSGATPYRLTSNSPARFSDSTAGDIGAFPYVSDATAGLVGTLWTNTTIGTSQSVLGDLTVPVGVTLTLSPGVVLTATASDLMQAGDTTRVELIVRGTLSVNAAANPVTLSSAGASAGSWVGVRVEAGGTLNANGLIVERATAGVDAYGTVTLTNGTLRTNTYGVRAQAGTTSVSTTLFSSNSYGAYGVAGSLTVNHATLVSNSYGVYSSGTSGAVSVTNSALTGNTYGLYRSNTILITNNNDVVWGNSSADYSSTSAGSGNITANPLYVGSGATPYRLTSNSPARFSDSTGTDIGAFPYTSDLTAGLVGTLWTNTTLTTGSLLGDLTIPAGVTVVLPAGVTLTASASDLMQAGDTTRVELIVRGTLSVTGTTAMPATLSSAGASAGSWVGVRVEASGTMNASGLVVERATAGVDAYGPVTITNSIFRTNTWGVRSQSGTNSVSGSLFTSNSYGAYGVAGSLTIDHSTLVSNSYGVYSSGTSGAVSVTNSALTGNTYGLYRSNTILISNSNDLVWGNSSADYSSTSAGTGNITANPLYVGTGGTPYRLTSNSPARFSDSTGTDIGAFPYVSDATAGLVGTLWTNTTIGTSQSLLGDLTVPQGVTLTLSPGVVLTAASSDLMQASDTTRVELIVRGTLTVSAANPVTLSAAGASAGSWVGVRVEATGALNANGLIVERATAGIDAYGPVTLTNATLRTNTYGVRTQGSTTQVSSSLLSSNSYGAYGVAGSLLIDHSTLVSNSYGVYSSGTSGAVTATNDVITGNTYGLYRSNTILISNSFDDVWGNSSANYSSTTAGTGSISSNPLYVGSGGTPYRLTSNSPARKSDSVGGDMGAFPFLGDATAGLVGTLWVDTTIGTSQSVLGDLTVPAGVTVTVSPGVVLTTTASDQMQAGADTTRVELIVGGTLVVNAVSNPVTLTSAGASAGSWTGVRVDAAGTAQLTGVVINRATSGVDAYGNVTLSDCNLGTNTYGVRVQSGSTTVARCLFTSNSYGAYGVAGSLNVDHSTFVSNSYGVYSSGTSGAVGVTNSVLTGNTYGLYRSNTILIGNSNDDVWGNSSANYSSTTAGTGNITANPLYVGSGTTPYRLTSNSPARKSDSTGGDMGAFPYVSDPTPGLVGTLWLDTTINTSQSVLGDLTVPPGVTVTIAPGTTLTTTTSDLMQAGNDTTRVELLVRGTLQISGNGAQPVTLTSSGASAGSWTGINVLAGGTASISSAVITRGSACLDLSGNATVTGSRFNTCTYGVRSNLGTHSVAFSVFDANSYGFYGVGGTDTLDHLTAYSNSYAVYSAGTSGSIAVTNSIFTSNTYSLYRSNTILISNSYNDLFNSPLSSTTQGSNTLTVDPLLVSPSTADFHLQAGSPARGAGTSSSDLGAFPFAPGPVDHIVLSPASVTTGAGATVTFTATAFDVTNNPVPSATLTWSALPAAGVINSSGVLTASCTPGSVTGGVTVTSNGKSASANVTITVGPIANLAVSPTNATVKSQQNQQFTVMALDACNNPVASPAISWSAVGSVGIIDSSGLYTAGCARGSYPMSIVATAGAITGRASVTVDPGVLSTVSISPTTASVAVNGSRQFTGSAADGCGNPLTSAITWTTNVTGGNVNTSGLFTAGTAPGTYPAGVTASATEGAITRSASADVSITGGAVATVMVMPGTATLSAGGTANFSAVALDSFGNMVAGAPTWSVVSGGGTINSAGLFTAGTTAGTYANTVRATVSGVSGTATVIVQPGAVTRVAVSPMTVTMAPGGTTTFTAQAFDTNNNVVSAPVTWTAQAMAGTITAGGDFTAGSMSGTYNAAVTATVNGVSGSANVTINPGALARLTVTPSVATTQAGGTVAFSAAGRDGNGNAVAVTPTWTVVNGGGTISAAGVFTAATTTGTFTNTVRAESNGVTAFATVSVTAGPLVRINLTPTQVDLMPAATQQFTAAGVDAFNNPVSVSITWSANAMAGTVTQSGLFTAGNVAGDYPNGVTATAGTISAVAAVRVGSPMMTDAGMGDAGMGDAGTGTDAGTMDAGQDPDAGQMMGSDAGNDMMGTDGGMGGDIHSVTACSCSQTDALFGLIGLVAFALRRRRR
ncbi:MAG: hypothetical protein U0228_22275 [Myxococcaceae bacterium]